VKLLLDTQTWFWMAIDTELSQHYRDPFDHLIVAQAKAEGMTLVTADQALRVYGVPILWG
jgi:PIN domain nuclease of toxin-antitoxin system